MDELVMIMIDRREFNLGKPAGVQRDRSTLKDIQSVEIDMSKPCKERVQSFIDQIGDPYCYADGDTVVEIAYADTQVSLQERLIAYASSIGQGIGNLR